MIKLSNLLNEDSPCWKGYKQVGMKDKDGRQVPNCVPVNEDEYTDKAQAMGDTPIDNPIDDYDELDVEQDDMDDFITFLKGYQTQLEEANCNCVYEAEYQGRDVKLGKPMQGDVKKFKVYVKNPKTGKIIKVNFGQKGMVIKKDNPERRKSFRARMHCDNPGPRTKANYWSCRKW